MEETTNKQITHRVSILQIWRSSLEFIFSAPVILAPFCINFAFGVFALVILYFAPHAPLDKIFAPIIIGFWGERWLHYPTYYYILLTKVFNIAEIAIAVVIGSLTTAMAVFLASKYDKSERLSLKQAFRFSFRKYIVLFIIIVLLVVLSRTLVRAPAWLLSRYFASGSRTSLLWIGANIWMRYLLVLINFIVIAFVQCLFIFAIPYVIIKKRGLFSALFGSAILFFRKFFIVFPIVFLPLLIYLPFVILKNNQAFFMDRMYPELFIMPFLVVSVLVGNVVIDAFITISAVILFLQITDEK